MWLSLCLSVCLSLKRGRQTIVYYAKEDRYFEGLSCMLCNVDIYPKRPRKRIWPNLLISERLCIGLFKLMWVGSQK